MAEPLSDALASAVAEVEAAFGPLDRLDLTDLRRRAQRARAQAQGAGPYRAVDPTISRAARVLAAGERFAGELRRLRSPL
jgi:hypothetical protein